MTWIPRNCFCSTQWRWWVTALKTRTLCWSWPTTMVSPSRPREMHMPRCAIWFSSRHDSGHMMLSSSRSPLAPMMSTRSQRWWSCPEGRWCGSRGPCQGSTQRSHPSWTLIAGNRYYPIHPSFGLYRRTSLCSFREKLLTVSIYHNAGVRRQHRLCQGTGVATRMSSDAQQQDSVSKTRTRVIQTETAPAVKTQKLGYS